MMKSSSCTKLCQNFDVFGLPNFRGKGVLMQSKDVSQ